MGFRDYETFNQALLAKQGWRLLTKPSSLCARVLKARYFKNCDFRQAPCPGRASATWRGIIHGRELLREGLVWRIGDGTQVSVMKDKWIPRSGAQQPLGQKLEGKAVQVADLLCNDGKEWNDELLREIFYDGDVSDIKQVPLGGAGTDDYLAWNYTKRVFSLLGRLTI
jgi:hypothetical protein